MFSMLLDSAIWTVGAGLADVGLFALLDAFRGGSSVYDPISGDTVEVVQNDSITLADLAPYVLPVALGVAAIWYFIYS